jgi:hypothetical protein
MSYPVASKFPVTRVSGKSHLILEGTHHHQRPEDIRSRRQDLPKSLALAFRQLQVVPTLDCVSGAFGKVPNVSHFELFDLVVPMLINS